MAAMRRAANASRACGEQPTTSELLQVHSGCDIEELDDVDGDSGAA